MEFISDVLLGAGALGAGFYCLVLSHRLRRFMQLEKGVGGAIATLSTQVDEMSRAVAQARRLASESTGSLADLMSRAEDAANRLEGLLASYDDLPVMAPSARPAPTEHGVRREEPKTQAHDASEVEDVPARRLRLVRRRGHRLTAEAA